ncbi:protein RMD5 homolog A isoform X1 [Tetranychus urticae]|nr:protein RMD5 homolog A isoform X1 [Tetranychus urticae]
MYTGGHRRTSQKSGSCNCFVCLIFGTNSSEHVAMDCIINVEKEVDNVIGKFSSVQDKTDQILMDLITNLQKLQRDLIFLSTSNQCELSGIQTVIINQNIAKIRDTISQVAMNHREIHGAVSKVGKVLDKNFISNYSHLTSDTFKQEGLNPYLLNQAIIEHFLRQGMLEIGEELMREAKISVPEEKKNPFSELNDILAGLKKHNVKPALEWIKANKEKLGDRHTQLEFKLHRLQFIEYLRQGVHKQKEMIEYARQNFQSFADDHEKEMQSLMGSLVFLKSGIAQSPYSHLLDPINWNEICDIFTRDACSLLGMSVESPLSVTFNAGTIALPALLNLRQVMLQSSVPSVWTTKDELPIPIDLGKNSQYHSIFACPILRQQSNDSNPPMKLICGHVISKDALNKLTIGNKLKCPYCPVEQNPTDARQIQF